MNSSATTYEISISQKRKKKRNKKKLTRHIFIHIHKSNLGAGLVIRAACQLCFAGAIVEEQSGLSALFVKVGAREASPEARHMLFFRQCQHCCSLFDHKASSPQYGPGSFTSNIGLGASGSKQHSVSPLMDADILWVVWG